MEITFSWNDTDHMMETSWWKMASSFSGEMPGTRLIIFTATAEWFPFLRVRSGLSSVPR